MLLLFAKSWLCAVIYQMLLLLKHNLLVLFKEVTMYMTWVFGTVAVNFNSDILCSTVIEWGEGEKFVEWC